MCDAGNAKLNAKSGARLAKRWIIYYVAKWTSKYMRQCTWNKNNYRVTNCQITHLF